MDYCLIEIDDPINIFQFFHLFRMENFFILFFKLATYFCIAFFQKDIIINYNIILHIRQCGIPDFFNSQIFVIHKGEYYLWKQNHSFMEVTPLLTPHFIMYRWTRLSALEPMSTHLDYPKTWKKILLHIWIFSVVIRPEITLLWRKWLPITARFYRNM